MSEKTPVTPTGGLQGDDQDELPKVTGRQVPMRTITIVVLFAAAVIVGLGAWLMSDGGPTLLEASQKSAAGPPDVIWDKTFGEKHLDAARDIAVINKNQFVIAARTRSKSEQANEAVWLLRINGRGVLQSERSFGGDKQQWVTGVGKMPDGGLVLVGASGKKRAIQAAAWVARTNSSGKVLWQRTFGGTKADGATGVVVLADGGLAIAGSISSKGSGNFDGWLIRLDRNGQLLWDRTFGGSQEDTFFAISATKDGGFAMVGSTVAAGEGGGDGWLVRVNGKGEEQWSKTFGGENYDVLNSIVTTPEGEFIVAGHTRSKGPPGGGAWLLKIGAKGKVVWERVMAGPGMSLANKVIALDDGGIVMVGLSRPSENSGDENAWMGRYDAGGKRLWLKSFGGEGDDNLLSVAFLRDGGFLGAGFTTTKGKGKGDVWLIRLGYK